MKRKLFIQMCNDWRSNVWLTIELVIVSVVLWVIFMFFTWMLYLSHRDKGYNTDDLYVAELKYVPSGSESYVPYDSAHSYISDLHLLEQQIMESPYVMHIGRGNNALPFNFNYHGVCFTTSYGDSTYNYYGNQRQMSAGLVRALELRGRNGETPDQLVAMLERGEILFSDADYSDWNIADFVGREIVNPSDSSVVRKVGAEVYPIPRSDYETSSGTVVSLIGENDWAQQVVIRVKPETGTLFAESMTADRMRLGNVYLSNLRSLYKDRDANDVDIVTAIRNMTVCGVFLMVVIFMGFLGTFWFRIQQRVPEIALRMVNGATRGDIFRRLLAEGFVMLIVSTVIAVIIDLLFCKYDILITQIADIDRLSPAWGMLEVFVSLALMVLAGICIPARKAMNINPAEALKDE